METVLLLLTSPSGPVTDGCQPWDSVILPMGVLQQTQSVFGPSQEESLAEGVPLLWATLQME